MIMKTLKQMFPVFLLIIGLFGFITDASPQKAKMTRAEKKEVQKAQMMANFFALDTILRARNFVLEADYLQDKYGVRMPVSSSLNFIRVDSLRGILQTGTNTGIGYNSVGGVTAEGRIGRYEITKDTKHSNYTVTYTLDTQIGHYDIILTVNSVNNASATITGLGPGRLTWEGHISVGYNSKVFKGQNTM
jgi:hypothetical protein